MKIIQSIDEMQEFSQRARGEGKTIAFVPTMGYLHEGHASLMREGRNRADILVASIFVNPTQFGKGEDFETYPRDMERDSKIAAEAGVDVIFTPTAAEMYPAGYQTYVNVEGLSLPLCGASRPGHFRGVTTVVTKLFNIVRPHTSLFGRKDFQQLAVIRRMTADLNLGVEIVGMPIVREPDGLAMSSRNAYLSSEERQQALCLYKAMRQIAWLYRHGERSAKILRKVAVAEINAKPSAAVDYVELRNSVTLEEVTAADDATLLALAVKIGKTRLIDNCILGEESQDGA
ncbi:MAG: pantoate--beta-alanine ligase [Geobacter sp.]|nr:pantoate--beta-alanine ligase [Geobacter sp.]